MAKSKTTTTTKTEETPAFVKIQSTVTVNVTRGLDAQNVTNKDAHVPDRLKVNPLWPKCMVQIKAGTHWYPAEITEWSTVKTLSNKGILTIGEYSDTASDDVVTEKKELERKTKEVDAKATSLEDIAD